MTTASVRRIEIIEIAPGRWQILADGKPWVAGIGPHAKDWYSTEAIAREISVAQRGAILASMVTP